MEVLHGFDERVEKVLVIFGGLLRTSKVMHCLWGVTHHLAQCGLTNLVVEGDTQPFGSMCHREIGFLGRKERHCLLLVNKEDHGADGG